MDFDQTKSSSLDQLIKKNNYEKLPFQFSQIFFSLFSKFLTVFVYLICFSVVGLKIEKWMKLNLKTLQKIVFAPKFEKRESEILDQLESLEWMSFHEFSISCIINIGI